MGTTGSDISAKKAAGAKKTSEEKQSQIKLFVMWKPFQTLLLKIV